MLKFVDENPDWLLVETGQSRSLLDVHVGWLKRFSVSCASINALCKLGKHSVESCLEEGFYNWVQDKRYMGEAEKQWLGLSTRVQWREFLGVPGKIRDARNLERLDQLYEAEKKRLLGADFGQQIVADEVQAKWPEMEAGVQAVLLATDGSRISEHPEDAKPSAGAAFAAFRGVGFESDSNPLTGKLRVCGKASSNRGEALALYAGMRACTNVPKLTVLIDSKVTMQGVAARFKGQFKPAMTQCALMN